MVLSGVKKWVSALAVGIFAAAVACNSYDKDLIQLSDAIMALPEPATFITDFDKKWEQSRENHMTFRAEIVAIVTGETPPALETIDAEIAKVKDMIELDLEYIKGAKALYHKEIAGKERVTKVALHAELMRDVLMRLLFAYSVSAAPLKESKYMDDRFAIENKINELVSATKAVLDRVTVAINNLGYSIDFENATRVSILKGLFLDLRNVGISLDNTQLAKSSLVIAKLRKESLPLSSDGYIQCSTSSSGYAFKGTGRFVNMARKSAIEECRRDSKTDAEMCEANVICNDGRDYDVFTSCKTFSQGYNFFRGSRSVKLAKSEAIRACVDHNRTYSTECNVNLSCDDGDKYESYSTCTTRSSGASFSHQSRDKEYSAKQAIEACYRSVHSDGRECRANLKCEEIPNT